MSAIHVDVCAPDPSIQPHWDELAQRASPNVFLHPAALNAAHALKFARMNVLLAWDRAFEPARLIGMWALGTRRTLVLGPSFLSAPPYDYAFVSSPLLDPACMDAAIAAMLEAIARHPALPKIIRLNYLDGESHECLALQRALTALGGRTLKFSERERPFVSREAGQKNSGSTRKKLRQDWNRLSALGAVDILNERSPQATRDAFETFLTMEAESWKGANGTALLSHDDTAAFARRLIGELADHDCASVALLRLAGEPIAAQVLLYSRSMAYTWKTSFRAEHGKFSPGALLVDKITEQLFASGAIEAIESCSPEGGFMSQMWSGRRSTIDLLADLRPRHSLGFAITAMSESGYLQAKELRKRLAAQAAAIFTRKGKLAVSR